MYHCPYWSEEKSIHFQNNHFTLAGYWIFYNLFFYSENTKKKPIRCSILHKNKINFIWTVFHFLEQINFGRNDVSCNFYNLFFSEQLRNLIKIKALKNQLVTKRWELKLMRTKPFEMEVKMMQNYCLFWEL